MQLFANHPHASSIEPVSENPCRLELLWFPRRVVEQQATAALRQIDG